MALPALQPVRRFDNPCLPDPQFYSHAVSVDKPGRFIFVSGQLGNRKDGSFPENLEDEVAQSLKNLVDTVKADGADASDLVKLTLYAVGWSHQNAEEFFAPFLPAMLSDFGVQGRPITTLVPVSQLADPRAHFEVDGLVAIADEARAWSLERPFNAHDAEATKIDVIVVGGGFSGLQAAVDVSKAGLKTIVLEASSRVGGRSYTFPLSGNEGAIELGATWINQITQPKIYELAQELGLDCVDQYNEGSNIWQGPDGKVHRLGRGGQIAPDSEPTVQAEVAAVLQKMEEEMQKNIDLARCSWEHGSAATVEEWTQSNTSNPYAQGLLRHAVRGLVGRESHEVGMHYFLDYVKSGGGFVDLLTEGKYGAQSLKIKQGTSAIANGLAAKLPAGSVMVSSPVAKIQQNKNGCLVTTTGGRKYQAKKVIVAIPTNTYELIQFVPSLPYEKRAIVSRTLPGKYAKILVTYKKPWWKTLGLSGSFFSMDGPICFSWEISDDTKGNYTLALFCAGDIAEKWRKLNRLQREHVLIEHLVELVGGEHADMVTDVVEINEKDWTDADWLGGAPTSAMQAGDLARYGHALRATVDNIHFAGGELAFEWKGYLEGALRSGSRAAAEVVSALV